MKDGFLGWTKLKPLIAAGEQRWYLRTDGNKDTEITKIFEMKLGVKKGKFV